MSTRGRDARFVALLVVLLVVVGLSAHARAQCAPQWLPGSGTTGVNGTVRVTIQWDPDGAGPMGPVLVVGGSFSAAGNAAASNIAVYDPVSAAWSALGAGTNDTVLALLALPNGELVAGGEFTAAGGITANRVARWNGSSWTSLGTGQVSRVRALAALSNGDIVAGGAFLARRWNGTAWSALGTGLSGEVFAFTTLPNGNLVAGGASAGIKSWNGTSWSALGAFPYGNVRALTTMPNGDVFVGGEFAGGVMQWNGASWLSPGAGTSSPAVFALTAMPNGDLIAGGDFGMAGSAFVSSIARWNGTTWSALGAGMSTGTFPTVQALATLPNGDLVAGGSFTTAGGVTTNRIARWNGTVWSALNPGWDTQVWAMAPLPGGDFVAGGPFTTIGGVPANHVARWNGTSWSALGAGVSGTGNVAIGVLLTLPNGDVVAGGSFTTAGGVTANNIARWDGANWSGLGTGTNGAVGALATLPNGDLVAGGLFTTAGGVTVNNIARWNGTSWSPLGAGLVSGTDSYVSALATRPNGDLVAAEQFYLGFAPPTFYSRVWRWNGTSWSLLGAFGGTPVPGVYALLALPNGDLVAGGDFTSVGNFIARWNGTSWSPLGSGMSGPFPVVTALAALPNGDIVAGGSFPTAGGVPASGVARWNGASWSAFGAGLNGGASPSVHDMVMLANGDLVASGLFTTAGGLPSVNLARLTATCPATAVPSNAGCPSSGGSNTLTATTLPWVDATFRATGTGLPTNALVLTVFGFTSFAQGAAPLTQVFAQALPGCDLLVAPDILGLLVTTTGSAQSQTILPNTPPLVGVTFHHQMVPIELDALGNWVAITATNALQLTAGIF